MDCEAEDDHSPELEENQHLKSCFNLVPEKKLQLSQLADWIDMQADQKVMTVLILL